MPNETTPPLPPGFKMDPIPELPPGFKLDPVATEGKKKKPSQIASQVGEFFGTLGSDIAAIPSATAQAVQHPWETIKGIGQAQGAELEAAKAAIKKGDYAEAIRRGFGYLIPGVGPAISEAGSEMQRGEYGKGLAHTVELTPVPEAALKGVTNLFGRTVRPAAKAAGKSIYEAELRAGSKTSLAQRKELVSRGLKGELPIEEKSLASLQPAINANKQIIETLTKDPASPYAARSVPIADLLVPVDKWIQRVSHVDKRAAAALQKARDTWAKTLGYEAPTSARQVNTGILGPSGQPISRTVPGTPGVADTTIAEAQRLKEDLYAVINSSAYAETTEPGTMTAGRKLAARGMKRGIEQAIPEEPIQAINHAIETDIRLKDTINSAIKRHPSWINDWAVFVLGAGAGEAIGGHIGGGAAAIGALTRMVARNPRMMSRLAIALNKSGMTDLSKSVLPAATAARTTEISTRSNRNGTSSE